MGTEISQEIGITTVCADLQLDNSGDTEDMREEHIKENSQIFISISLIYFLTNQLYFACLLIMCCRNY